MAKTGIGLIGCGKRLQGVVNGLLKAYSEDIEIRALCDSDPESITESREKFNPDAREYTDYTDLVTDNRIQWVMIGSWNCFHREHAVAALEAGKHVFCEKPLATTIKDCVAMKEAWEKSGLMFNIGFTLRYSPHYRKIVEIIQSGEIGDIISMEFNETLDFNHGGFIMKDWRRLTANSGTHLLEKCCHDIDLVNWITGSRARRVASFGDRNFFHPENQAFAQGLGSNRDGKGAYMTWRNRKQISPFTSDKDVVDNQVAIIEYENNIRATFHTNTNTIIPERRMYICGSRGTLRADVMTGQIEHQRIGFDTERCKLNPIKGSGHGGGDVVLVRELGESMLQDTPPSAGLLDGLNSAVTCFGIDQAMESGCVFDLKEYWDRIF